MIHLLARAAALFLVSTLAFAADAPPGKAEAAIRARLAAAMPGSEITAVSASPIAGIYEVVLDGTETAFVSADGVYLISGDMYQAQPKGLVNLTEQRKDGLRRAALAKADSHDFITFAAKGREKGVVYAFTDVDCGYCRKFHQEVPALNAAGITVNYLAFPRSGLEGETFRKMNAVWCAADRNKALTDAKRGVAMPAPPLACRSPVADQYRMGVAMGIRGTPAIFLADGTQVGGYISAAELVDKFPKR